MDTLFRTLLVWFLFAKTVYGSFNKADRKNVLFLISDDLRPELGCYAESHPGFESPPMHTPNIDALAEKSILFERAYVQMAICSPSRTSFLTGRRPDTTRVLDLDSYWRTMGGNFTTIPQYFKENGYHSVGVGKIFHPGKDASGLDDPISWSEKNYHGKTNWGSHDNSWIAITPEQFDNKPPQDTQETQYAVNKLKDLAAASKNDNEPFFLALGLHKPHLPFVFPEDFLSYYPMDVIEVPKNSYAPGGMPDIAWTDFAELRNFADASNDAMGVPNLGEINVTYPDYKVKELRRAYYAAVSYMDSSIGQILYELANQGLEENTIVVFFGDHGWQLGEHAEWCKHDNFMISAHTPLMIRVPGVTDTSGMRTSKLVEFVDIFPTLAEVAGLDTLNTCPLNSNDVLLCSEGTSLVPLMDDPGREDWKEAVFWQYQRHGMVNHIPRCMGYSICTEKYHYTEWIHITVLDEGAYEPDWNNPCDHEELYDLEKHPKENHNFYDDPVYEEIKIELSQRLRKGWRKEIS